MNRRTFLRATGVALGLPWLECLDAAAAPRDESPAPPKRMVFICTALGLHGPTLYPKTTGAKYESTPYLAQLKKHRKQLTLFSGLSHPDQGGEHETLFTFLSAARNPGQDGFRNSISIDQFAAEKLGYVTRSPSVVLSTHGPSSQSFTSSGVMVPAEFSPSKLFSKLFLQGNPQEIARQKRKLHEGKSILDELEAQTRTLQRNASSTDKQRLEEYFESVRESERDLREALAWIDRPKPKVTAVQPIDIPDKTDLIGRTRLLLGLVPLIVQTDSSRVVSVVIQDHHVIPQVAGVSSEHHNLSHHGKDPAKIEQLQKIEHAIVSCFGTLLNDLSAKKEADRSLLDNTMTLFGSNLGNANSHDWRNLPIVLAGGGFQHGKYVAHDRNDNTPLSNLFVRMLQQAKIEADSFATSSGALSW